MTSASQRRVLWLPYAGDRAGRLLSEVTFDDQRWFELDPENVVVKLEGSDAPGAYSFQPSGGLLPLAIWRVL